jgi:hypothetical protein
MRAVCFVSVGFLFGHSEKSGAQLHTPNIISAPPLKKWLSCREHTGAYIARNHHEPSKKATGKWVKFSNTIVFDKPTFAHSLRLCSALLQCWRGTTWAMSL